MQNAWWFYWHGYVQVQSNLAPRLEEDPGMLDESSWGTAEVWTNPDCAPGSASPRITFVITSAAVISLGLISVPEVMKRLFSTVSSLVSSSILCLSSLFSSSSSLTRNSVPWIRSLVFRRLFFTAALLRSLLLMYSSLLLSIGFLALPPRWVNETPEPLSTMDAVESILSMITSAGAVSGSTIRFAVCSSRGSSDILHKSVRGYAVAGKTFHRHRGRLKDSDEISIVGSVYKWTYSAIGVEMWQQPRWLEAQSLEVS